MNPHITMARKRAANRRAHSPSHESRAPRTMYEAFEDPTGLERDDEPGLEEIIWSVVGIVLAVATFGFVAFAGAGIFGLI